MFDTPDAARQHFAEHFSRPQIEFMIEALEPSIIFAPVPAAKPRLGGSRIGGTPDLPVGLAWPVPTFPANVAELATRGGPEANEELKEHIALKLPYAFFAQVDLAEAKALGAAAADLPGEGRLLFFYDLMAGPYENGVWTGRVIWDRSLAEELKPQTLPEPLKKASDERPTFSAEFDERMRKEYGGDAATHSPGAGTPYGGPARAMTLKATLRPPAKEAIEVAAHPELKAQLAKQSENYEETFSDRYGEMFGERFDPFYGAANRGHRNRLLGGPLPEQSDPRYDAVVVTEFGKQHLGSDEWKTRFPEIEAKAKDWRLLLQIDVADWMQDDGEGTVYFLIRADDLKERRFERVVAVYHQT
jgi:uncharacterized protein YwqG